MGYIEGRNKVDKGQNLARIRKDGMNHVGVVQNIEDGLVRN